MQKGERQNQKEIKKEKKKKLKTENKKTGVDDDL